jgi:hypothetical protein
VPHGANSRGNSRHWQPVRPPGCPAELAQQKPTLNRSGRWRRIGFLFVKIQDYPKAEPLLQEALRIRQKVLGPEHLTSEQQRLAYLHVFHPYSLFPFLKGTESDFAAAILRYKGVVQDSIVEDRLLAEANGGSEDQKLVEQGSEVALTPGARQPN